jgi:hypothetical protein
MSNHKLQRRYEGEGIMQKITPACSCGWVGIGYEAHNDYQYTLVKEQEDDHIVAAHRAERAALSSAS